jgi:tRNA threonylcarbamoyladenosine biosynthesis protein TsaB
MLLALDTSTLTMGIALYDDPVVIGEMMWRTASHHTVELAPAVSDLLHRCSLATSDVKAVAVALGPGSFTSLRIGLAFAKGLSLSLSIPVIGIPTFDYQVANQPLTGEPMLTVLPAGRSRMAVQEFAANDGQWQAVDAPQVMTPEEISDRISGPTRICGEMNAVERQIIGRKWKNAMVTPPALSMRRPSVLAELAWKRWKSGLVDDPVQLAPIYLHIAGMIQE